MALATNTTPGSVVLGGDLTGVANAPELRVTGVIPGTYGPVDIVVDNKGRLIYARTSTWVDDLEPILPVGSPSNKGPVYALEDCGDISLTNGVMALNMSLATYTTKGAVILSSNFDNLYGVLTANYAESGLSGVVKIGANLVVGIGGFTNNGNAVTPATDTVLGVVKPGTSLEVSLGVLSVSDASYSVRGLLKVTSGGALSITSGVLSGRISTTSQFGFIKSGSNFTVTAGVLSSNNLAKSANVDNINIVGGGLNTGTAIPTLSSNNIFSKAVGLSTLTVSSTTLTPDLSAYNIFDATAQPQIAINAPVNAVAGSSFTILGTPSFVPTEYLTHSIATNTAPQYVDGDWDGIKFIILSEGSTLGSVRTSTDGRTWSAAIGTTAQTISGISGGRISSAGSIAIIAGRQDMTPTPCSVSSDGCATWAVSTFPMSNVSDVSNNGSLFMCIGYQTTTANPRVYTSTNGTDWALVSTPGFTGGVVATRLSYANGYFWATATGTQIARSVDGTSWTVYTVPSSKWTDVRWNGSVYCLFANIAGVVPGTYTIAVSSDLVSWTTASLPAGWGYGIACVGGNFITTYGSVYSVSGTVYGCSFGVAHSTDGVNWTYGDLSTSTTAATRAGVILANSSRYSVICDYDASNLNPSVFIKNQRLSRTNVFMTKMTQPVSFKKPQSVNTTYMIDDGQYQMNCVYDGTSYFCQYINFYGS